MKSLSTVVAVVVLGSLAVALLAFFGLPYSPFSSAQANPYIQTGEIQGLKFDDIDSDGVKDPGEPGVSGVFVCVSSVGCTVTDGSGNYSFTGLEPNTYTVQEFSPNGRINTTPVSQTVVVAAGQTVTVNFGNRATAPPPSDIVVTSSNLGTDQNGTPRQTLGTDLVIKKTIDPIAICVPVGNPIVTMTFADGSTRTVDMLVSGSNEFTAVFLASPPFPFGPASMRIDIDCPDPTPDAVEVGDVIFLDPSGTIFNGCTNQPLEGATVTLLQESPAGSGTFIVPSTSDHLPAINPQTTGSDGRYSWDVVAGTYKVRAEKAGFVTGDTAPVVVPPPATGLDIVLLPISGCLVQVSVDIKPGSDPNSINPTRKGVIPVAILTADNFDATTVAGSTVLFAGASPTHGDGHLEDVDGDGDIDWLGHFRVRETDIAKGDTEACLAAETEVGQTIEGCDAIKTVEK